MATRHNPSKPDGYDPIVLTRAAERTVVKGNQRKYARLSRPLRFYGGITSAQEVGCNLRCKFCFSDKPVRRPQSTGRFYSPQEVFEALTHGAKKNGHRLISASASEGTLGKKHLFELLTLVDQSDYIFVLETNGMTIGNDPSFAKELSQFKNLHVRVSIKGCTAHEYNQLTGADSRSYDLPYEALDYLMDAGVSCNVCLMISFSTAKTIDIAETRLSSIRPGLLKSLEKEHITLFPKVATRLNNENLSPKTIRHRGKIMQFNKENYYV
ncbi:MAG: radical SAM protein [Candidatus Marinimicrobia bacterium]|nr:radical SAM protein [Candidatus Neomarinimicrobiota bacterium]